MVYWSTLSQAGQTGVTDTSRPPGPESRSPGPPGMPRDVKSDAAAPFTPSGRRWEHREGGAAQRPKGEAVWGAHEWTRLHRTPEETPLADPVSSLALLCAPYDPTLLALVPDPSLRPLSTRLLNSGSTRGTGLVWLRRESKSSAVHFVLGCIVYTRSLISVVRVNENWGIWTRLKFTKSISGLRAWERRVS